MCDLHRMLSIKEDVTDGASKTRDEIKNIYGILVKKPYTKMPFGILGHRWHDNTKTDLRWIGCEGENFFQLAELGQMTKLWED